MKTDRRDALKLARSYRAGDLTPVWVPDAAHEALRDLVRAREAAKKDQLRARHRLGKFLLRQGRRPPTGIKAGTRAHLKWVKTVQVEAGAQEATLLDGVRTYDPRGLPATHLRGKPNAAIEVWRLTTLLSGCQPPPDLP